MQGHNKTGVTPLTACTTILATRITRRRSGWCTRSRTPGCSCSRTPTSSRSCGAAGRRPSTAAAAGERGGGFTTRSGATTAATSPPAPGPGTAPYIQVSRQTKIWLKIYIHCIKRFAVFPSPLTKLSLAGKTANLFLKCRRKSPNWPYSFIISSVFQSIFTIYKSSCLRSVEPKDWQTTDPWSMFLQWYKQWVCNMRLDLSVVGQLWILALRAMGLYGKM